MPTSSSLYERTRQILAKYIVLLSIFVFIPLSSVFASTQDPNRTVFVQLFEWKWPDVARECETYLGPKGFKAVQISPPQEHVVVPDKGYPWWQNYQPVSYKIESRMGTRAEFTDMVSRCNTAGVQIYADVVINHMASGSGTGSAGSTYTNNSGHAYTYPGIYQQQDFHWNVSGPHNCQNADGSIDYMNQHAVQDCELVSLPDLATETEYVRTRIADYLVDLYSLGVRGYRIDAVKHIDPADVDAIFSNVRARVGNNFYVVQEIIDLGGEAVKKEWYYNFGDVDDFVYGRKISEQFKNQNGQKLANLKSFGASWGLVKDDKSVVFSDNHDMQRGEAANYLTYKDNNNHFIYTLGNVFMLAWPYGYPQLMSSYDFTNFDQSPPSSGNGTIKSIYPSPKAKTPNCFTEWKCEHRWREIGNMVAFRNATFATSQVNNWWDNGNNQIAFGRGDKGFVVINREDTPLTRTFQTRLPPGTYCDIISGDFLGKSRKKPCTGQTIPVDANRNATITVPPNYAAAIHENAMTSAKKMVTVTFNVSNAETVIGQNVYLAGDDAGLGSWSPENAVLMTPGNYPNWQVKVKLLPSKKYSFKFVKIDSNGVATWESISNLTFKTPARGTVSVNKSWNTQ